MNYLCETIAIARNITQKRTNVAAYHNLVYYEMTIANVDDVNVVDVCQKLCEI